MSLPGDLSVQQGYEGSSDWVRGACSNHYVIASVPSSPWPTGWIFEQLSMSIRASAPRNWPRVEVKTRRGAAKRATQIRTPIAARATPWPMA